MARGVRKSGFGGKHVQSGCRRQAAEGGRQPARSAARADEPSRAALRADNRAIFKAASGASKAADFLLSHASAAPLEAAA